jgi:hypothetical protein
MDILKLIKETRATLAKGSAAGRSAGLGSSKKDHSKSTKARVKVYKSITDALTKGYVGQIFSTKNADRLYVITKQKWGKSGQQTVNGRTAKGFTQGSIPASFKDVKKYSVRTMVRHGHDTSSRYKGDDYWKTKRK